MKNGICLLCFGDSSFGKLTYNLVASIKEFSNIHVTIFSDIKSIKGVDNKIFDSIVEIPENSFYVNKKAFPLRWKLFLNTISPYENTMCLDVDSLYFSNKSIEDLFDLLNLDVDLIGQNEQTIDLQNSTTIFGWYDINNFIPRFEFTKNIIHQLHGQFFLFKKNDNTKLFFQKAREIYDKIYFKEINNTQKWEWFGQPLEELCMTLATGLTDVSILDNFAPVSVQTHNLDYEQILKYKSFISICGSSTKEFAEKNGGYCNNEELSSKYIKYYNKRTKELKKYKYYNYIEKVYNL